MNNTLIQVKDLTIKFKTKEGLLTALDRVSFSLQRGKVVGLVGESGCGKSITSLAIMKLLDERYTQLEGEITFKDQNILELPDKKMRHIRGNQISMIFQEPMTALNPIFTIGFQLEEVIKLHTNRKKEARDLVIQMLKRVGIPRADKVVDEYPHQLSGGMRQRVVIAMALLCHPEILIADEATTALDVTIQAQVLSLISELIREYQTGVLFITHDLGVIAEIADEVCVMYAGRIVEQASVEELFERPMHPYTIGLLNSRPGLASKGEKLTCIPGMVPSLKNMPQGCAFSTRCSGVCERCKMEKPELVEVSKGHFVSCFPAQEGERGYGI